MDNLINNFKDKAWFHSIGKDQYGRYIVYVNSMTPEVMELVPPKFDNKQVLTHFANSIVNQSEFINQVSLNKTLDRSPILATEEESMEDIIWALRRECGTDNLMDILNEIHEQSTGRSNMFLTDNSKEFPEVRKELEDLYEEFGLDVLFEQINLEK